MSLWLRRTAVSFKNKEGKVRITDDQQCDTSANTNTSSNLLCMFFQRAKGDCLSSGPRSPDRLWLQRINRLKRKKEKRHWWNLGDFARTCSCSDLWPACTVNYNKGKVGERGRERPVTVISSIVQPAPTSLSSWLFARNKGGQGSAGAAVLTAQSWDQWKGEWDSQNVPARWLCTGRGNQSHGCAKKHPHTFSHIRDLPLTIRTVWMKPEQGDGRPGTHGCLLPDLSGTLTAC